MTDEDIMGTLSTLSWLIHAFSSLIKWPIPATRPITLYIHGVNLSSPPDYILDFFVYISIMNDIVCLCEDKYQYFLVENLHKGKQSQFKWN